MDDGYDGSGRRRKGSLRKTVLLGVERLRLDRRAPDDPGATAPHSASKKLKSPTRSIFELPSANSSTESYGAATAADKFSSPSNADSEASAPSVTSPTSPAYTSNTDEDDSLALAIPASAASSRPSASPSPPSSDTSSVPAVASNNDNGNNSSGGSVPRQRAHPTLGKKTSQSPLGAATNPSLAPIEEEWDYSETAWWGWVILIVTWVVFVVGMGSAFEVWSWAWDVGHTPYAPPELEDDPTLPIVGYYPALFVLTAVMSWIWVMVAWMGLKYFKHAKFQEYEGS